MVTDSQGFELTPHNLKYTAAVFRQVADRFHEMTDGAAEELRVTPWLGDQEPVSTWAADQFNQHFAVFVQRLTQLGEQHHAMADSLTQAREKYLEDDHLRQPPAN